jgi:hypothetical protein
MLVPCPTVVEARAGHLQLRSCRLIEVNVMPCSPCVVEAAQVLELSFTRLPVLKYHQRSIQSTLRSMQSPGFGPPFLRHDNCFLDNVESRLKAARYSSR